MGSNIYIIYHDIYFLIFSFIQEKVHKNSAILYTIKKWWIQNFLHESIGWFRSNFFLFNAVFGGKSWIHHWIGINLIFANLQQNNMHTCGKMYPNSANALLQLIGTLLPAAYEVWMQVMFLHVFVCPRGGGEGGSAI